MDERLAVFEDKMEKAVSVLKSEYDTIRSCRTCEPACTRSDPPWIIYGVPSGIQQVANVSVPEPRMLVIQPWEKSLIKAIEKAILTSDLGINPSNDGSVIRLCVRRK